MRRMLILIPILLMIPTHKHAAYGSLSVGGTSCPGVAIQDDTSGFGECICEIIDGNSSANLDPCMTHFVGIPELASLLKSLGCIRVFDKATWVSYFGGANQVLACQFHENAGGVSMGNGCVGISDGTTNQSELNKKAVVWEEIFHTQQRLVGGFPPTAGAVDELLERSYLELDAKCRVLSELALKYSLPSTTLTEKEEILAEMLSIVADAFGDLKNICENSFFGSQEWRDLSLDCKESFEPWLPWVLNEMIG